MDLKELNLQAVSHRIMMQRNHYWMSYLTWHWFCLSRIASDSLFLLMDVGEHSSSSSVWVLSFLRYPSLQPSITDLTITAEPSWPPMVIRKPDNQLGNHCKGAPTSKDTLQHLQFQSLQINAEVFKTTVFHHVTYT